MTQALQKLNQLIDSLPNNNVLCIGDIMLDEYISGPAERISPEAPVSVIRHIQTKQVLGGVGNVAVNLTALDCKASAFYAVGPDSDGQLLTNMLQEKGVTVYPHKLARLTTKKQRILAHKQQVCRVDFEEKLQLNKQQEDKIIHQIKSLLPQHNVVILSDYDKGLLTPRITQAVIQASKQQNKLVLVDPKGYNYRKYQEASLIKPNLGELNTAIRSLMTDFVPDPPLDPANANDIKEIQLLAKLLCQTVHIDQAVVTLSSHGMIGTDCFADSIYRPTAAQAVADVSGAGDTSLALLAASLGAHARLEEAIDLANIGAGVVVGKEGTATISRKELKSSLRAFFKSITPLLSPKGKGQR